LLRKILTGFPEGVDRKKDPCGMILSYRSGGESMKRRRVAVTISLPPEIAKDYERIADQEAKNKSQLFRDMFLLYREKTLWVNALMG
jgi:hypothetical protein